MTSSLDTVYRTDGFLKVFVNQSGIKVDVSRQIWRKHYSIQAEILEYFKKQGYCEAVELPYDYQPGCLTVTANVENFYQKPVKTEYDPIPF